MLLWRYLPPQTAAKDLFLKQTVGLTTILESIQFVIILYSCLFTITDSTKKNKNASKRVIRLNKHWINQDITKLHVPEAEYFLLRFYVIIFTTHTHTTVLLLDIKDVCTDTLGLSPLHPQCFASSAGAVLGAVLDPLQHSSGGRSRTAGAVFSDNPVGITLVSTFHNLFSSLAKS